MRKLQKKLVTYNFAGYGLKALSMAPSLLGSTDTFYYSFLGCSVLLRKIPSKT